MVGLLSVLLLVVGMVCWIIIMVEAFQNEVWKGLLCLFCPFYIVYYALVEYEAEKKWVVVGLFLGGWAIQLLQVYDRMGHGPLGR